MPESINVIRLSESERETLREVTSPNEVKAVSKAVTSMLRTGGETSRSAAQAVEMDPQKFRALKHDLTTRLETLSALPVDAAVKQPLVERTEEALGIVDESLRMLNGASG